MKHEKIKRVFSLTSDELDAITKNKSNHDIFALYMTALDHEYCNMSIFKLHGFDMHTEITEIQGFTSLFQLLCKVPFDMRKHRELFLFIANSISMNRTLKPDELY